MGALSDFLENKLADHTLGASVYTPPSNVYMALFTAGPTDAGGGTEVTGGSYNRSNIANNSTNWPTASGGQKQNGTAISFPAATGAWGTITHFGIYDAITGGNLLFWGALNTAKTIASGDTPSFPIGSFLVNWD